MLPLSLSILFAFSAVSIAQDTNVGEVRRAFTAAHVSETINFPFDPKVLLQVTYPQTDDARPITLQAGVHLPRNATLRLPIFNVVGSRSKGPFVVAAVDPDTPTPQEPTLAQVRHFLGGNFYMGSHTRPTLLSNSTPAISHYREPRPQAGSDPHRYIFLLFDQPSGFDEQSARLVQNDDDTSTANWNVSAFAAAAGLGQPVGGTFMFVAPDPTT
ncbi:PEBP-like protein [Pholiota molesta]|nr:PEBP-like protein [Pholiota molesta]